MSLMMLFPYYTLLASMLGAATLVLLLTQPTRGFTSPPPHSAPFRRASPPSKQRHESWIRTSPSLYARKKRRRRKAPKTDEPSTDGSDTGDELPDFDLDEGGADGSSAAANVSPAVNKKVASSSSSSINSSDPLGEISANMMGSADRPTRSLNDLLNDRALESKMQFDNDVTEGGEELPDLAALDKQEREFERQTGLPSTTSKKRARQEARRAAAVASKEEEENLLAKLPFIRDDKGEISALKILENSTWACIGLLILWEIYINTPFFDRAAPMAPIVYEFFL